MEGLTEGRIVHYVSEDNYAGKGPLGHCQAAIVVQVFKTNGKPPANGVCNLAVVPDGSNDIQGNADDAMKWRWKTSRTYEKQTLPGHWHWPQECLRVTW